MKNKMTLTFTLVFIQFSLACANTPNQIEGYSRAKDGAHGVNGQNGENGQNGQAGQHGGHGGLGGDGLFKGDNGGNG